MEVGTWLADITSEDELIARLDRLLKEAGERLTQVQYALKKPLNAEDGDVLAKQLVWIDAQIYFMGSLYRDAVALLDVAEKFYFRSPGLSVLCTDEEGRLIPATGSRVTDQEDEKFVPKYQTLSEADRKIDLRAKTAAYRRLTGEFEVITEAIKNRQFLGQRVLEELTARTKATGAGSRNY